MKIDGIQGQSYDRTHQDWINVRTFFHSIEKLRDGTRELMHATIDVDRSLPDLVASIDSQTVFRSLLIEGIKDSQEGGLEIRYHLSDVRLVSLQSGQFTEKEFQSAHLVFAFKEIEIALPLYDSKTGSVIETLSNRRNTKE